MKEIYMIYICIHIYDLILKGYETYKHKKYINVDQRRLDENIQKIICLFSKKYISSFQKIHFPVLSR